MRVDTPAHGNRPPFDQGAGEGSREARMSRQSRPRIASLWTLVGVLALSHPGEPAHAADDGSFSIEPEESFEDEEGDRST